MEDLISLSKLISKQKVKQIDIIYNLNDLSPISKKFYLGLASSLITNDTEAVEYLYDERVITSKYRKLKERLRQKLINTLFFIDIQQYSRNDYEKVLVNSYLLLSAVRILRSRGFQKGSSILAEHTLKKALKFDIIDISYYLSVDLVQYYSVFNFSRKKLKQYKELESSLLESFILERKAKDCFTYFAAIINQNKDYDRDKIPSEVYDSLVDCKNNLETNQAFDFNYQFRNALYFKAYLENNNEEMIDISESAVKYFESKSGFSRLGEFSFLQKLGVSYQIKKNFESAIECYQKALKIQSKAGSTSWYNIRFHLFNVNLHLRNYQKAYNYLLEATKHKAFKSLYSLYREPWILKEAYMHLLIKMGKVQEEKTNKIRLRPFRISRFLNEVEHFSKDKRGLNIAVNIIHALFLFLQKKEDDFERRLDALGQYSFRYLRNDDTLRSNAFIKMLQKIPDAGYHPIRLQRHTKKYYKRMIEAPMVIQENSKEVEIIPYEHLWDIVLELLELRMDKRI